MGFTDALSANTALENIAKSSGWRAYAEEFEQPHTHLNHVEELSVEVWDQMRPRKRKNSLEYCAPEAVMTIPAEPLAKRPRLATGTDETTGYALQQNEIHQETEAQGSDGARDYVEDGDVTDQYFNDFMWSLAHEEFSAEDMASLDAVGSPSSTISTEVATEVASIASDDSHAPEDSVVGLDAVQDDSVAPTTLDVAHDDPRLSYTDLMDLLNTLLQRYNGLDPFPMFQLDRPLSSYGHFEIARLIADYSPSLAQGPETSHIFCVVGENDPADHGQMNIGVIPNANPMHVVNNPMEVVSEDDYAAAIYHLDAGEIYEGPGGATPSSEDYPDWEEDKENN